MATPSTGSTRPLTTLGDSASDPKYIETVPGRGHRFIARSDSPAGLAEQPDNVIPIRPPEPAPVEPEPPLTLPWWRRKAPVAITACVVTAGLLNLWVAPQIERMRSLNELRKLTVVPLTALPGGRVWSPTFSPDGNQIAFVWSTTILPTAPIYTPR
jgi:hypothetical protein